MASKNKPENTAPILILNEPHSRLLIQNQNGIQLIEDVDDIHRFLLTTKGKLCVFIHSINFHTLENHLPYKETPLKHLTETNTTLTTIAQNHFHTLDGVGWEKLNRHSLSTPAILPETLTLYLLAHIETSTWLKKWLDVLSKTPRDVQKITPLPVAFCHLYRSLSKEPFRKTHKMPKYIDFLYIHLPQLRSNFLLVVLQGSFIHARYFKNPPTDVATLNKLFIETAHHYDKFPGTRQSAPRFWAPPGICHLKEASETAKWTTLELLSEHHFLQSLKKQSKWKNGLLNLNFPALTLHQRLDKTLSSLKWIAVLVALLAIPYSVLQGIEAYKLYSHYQHTKEEIKQLDRMIGALPPTSTERIDFMTKMKALKTAYDAFQKTTQKSAPIAILPKLAESLRATWRSQRLKWQEDADQQAIDISVRYVGPELPQEDVIQDFSSLAQSLRSFFPSANVEILDAPFEGDLSRDISLRELQELHQSGGIKGKIRIGGQLQ